jgi:Tfp pilus assembly protein PilN
MLRTNLSTRPFYNERGVHAILMVAAAIVVLLTIFNLTQIIVLSRRQSELGGRAAAAERRAGELRAHALQVRQSLNPKELEGISGAAREANAIIGQRLFSWTELLNQLETTLPDDVRISLMRPRVEKDEITLVMTATGRNVDDIERFMGNLEATTAFEDVFLRDEDATDEGLLQVVIDAKYRPATGTGHPTAGAVMESPATSAMKR